MKKHTPLGKELPFHKFQVNTSTTFLISNDQNHPHHLQNKFLPYPLLILVILAVYFPIVNQQYAGWDDVRFVDLVRQPGWDKAWSIVTDSKLSHGSELYYNPLHLLSLMLDQALCAADEPTAWISKLTNLIFHTLNTLLLYYLLVMFFGTRLPAFIGALVFGLHPLQVSTVAWIAERKNLLACFFYLGSLISFLWYLRSYKSGMLIVTCICFLCSLLSKPIAVTLPIILATLVILERGFVGLRNSFMVVFLLVMLCISAAWGLFVISTEHTHSSLLPPLVYRPLLASGILAFYFSKFIVPLNLIAQYPRWDIYSQAPLFAGFLVTFAGAAFVIINYRKRIDNRILWSIAFILVNLSLTSGLAPFAFMGHSYVADHFMYLPMIGVSVLIAGLVQFLNRRYSFRSLTGKFFILAIFIWISILAVLSSHQTELWTNPTTVWQSTLKANPESYAANNNYGIILMEQANYDDAVRYFNTAVKIAPNADMAYINLGKIAAIRGNCETALKYYARACRINPNSRTACAMEGKLLRQLGRNSESINFLEDALKKRLNSSELRYELGISYFVAGLKDKAEEQFAQAIENSPFFPEPYYQLGAILLSKGQVDKSIDLLEKANRFSNLVEIHNALGAAYAQKGDFPKALDEFVKAYKIEPNFRGLRDNLANALIDSGRKGDAERFCDENAKGGNPCSDETLTRIGNGS